MTFLTLLTNWEGPIAVFTLFGLALRLNSTPVGLAAAALSIPFCTFASRYPIIGRLAWTALLGNVLSGMLMRRRPDLAFAAMTPFAAICVFLTVLAMRGIRLMHH